MAAGGGGPADVIGVDGGVVVEPSDEQALVAAMLRLADPETARQMGAAAQARADAYTGRDIAASLRRDLEKSLASIRETKRAPPARKPPVGMKRGKGKGRMRGR